MQARGRGVTMAQAGWLWADLLLGLFAIFAVATTVGGPELVLASAAPSATGAVREVDPAPAVAAVGTPGSVPLGTAARPPGIDPLPLELVFPMNGAALLSADPRAVAAEQARLAAEIIARVGDRRVAVVLAYGSHADLRTGDRLAELATAGLRTGAFESAAVRAFHNQVAGDRGSSLQLALDLYQR